MKKAVIFVNAISLSRIFAGIVIYWLVVFPHNYLLALIIYLIFLFTDFLDGLLAKKYQATTKYGAEIDAISDALLIVLTISAVFVDLNWNLFLFFFSTTIVLILWISQFIVKDRQVLSKILTITGIIGFIIGFFLLIAEVLI